jgi:hypothetical protein
LKRIYKRLLQRALNPICRVYIFAPRGLVTAPN